MRLVDIGVNLTNRTFGRDLDAVVRRSHEAGVDTFVITGTGVAASRDAVALATRFEQFATAGIHPHHAKDADGAALETIREIAADSRVVAIGECGLDYDRNYSPPEDQRRAFVAQLELASTLGLPVFLHERAAHADFVAILRAHRSAIPRAVVHCFTGTRAELDAYLALDLHVGITGWICDERRGQALREATPAIPLDRLMLETDAPYLLPRSMPHGPKDRRNEPAFLPHVLEAVAAVRGEAREDVARATTATACAFFKLPA